MLSRRLIRSSALAVTLLLAGCGSERAASAPTSTAPASPPDTIGLRTSAPHQDAPSQAPTTSRATPSVSTTTPPCPGSAEVLDDASVVVMGDSLAEQIAVALAETSPAHIHHLLSIGASYNFGRSARGQLTTSTAAHDPDIVVIAVGYWDVASFGRADRVELDRIEYLRSDDYAQELTGLRDVIADGVPVLWLLPPPPEDALLNRGIEAVAAATRTEAERRDDAVLDPRRVLGNDLWHLFAEADGAVIAARNIDGVHYSDDGARLVSAAVADLAASMLRGAEGAACR